MHPKSIRISDFDYPLPDEKIALHPLSQRDGCRLIYSDSDGTISHHRFYSLPELIPEGSLIIANETKVIRARMEFFKESGSRIEIFLLEPLSPADYVLNFASEGKCSWSCMIGNLKRWKSGSLSRRLPDGTTLSVTRGRELEGNAFEIVFEWDNPSLTFASVVEEAGNIPIPPYLKRKSEESDTDDYQTVFSRTEGSVAAPTAGLHFTPELISRLEGSGNRLAKVTLHVGAGTFQPVKSEEIGDHPMHSEWISVPKGTIVEIREALRSGRPVTAVGTTSVRTLESLPYFGLQLMRGVAGDSPAVSQWSPYEKENSLFDTVESLEAILDYLDRNGLDNFEGRTSIMIAPGFRWRIVNFLVTNFHQPKSTLLLLVSSFLQGNGSFTPSDRSGAEPEQWRKIYREALERDYRFLSYGDACLLSPLKEQDRRIRLPLSKSIALRMIMINYMAGVPLDFPYICDDTEDLLEALNILVAADDNPCEIFFRLGAAPLRFFIALAASTPGVNMVVDAAPQLRRRPLRPLIDALRQAGADIVCMDREGSLPLKITGIKLKGGEIEVSADISSQFLSALLLVAPMWENGSTIKVGSERMVSRPYVEITTALMNRCGIRTVMENERYMVAPGNYAVSDGLSFMETDWSAAAFFYGTKLVIPTAEAEFLYLTPATDSLQGDARGCGYFETLGILTRYNDDGGATLVFDKEKRDKAAEGITEFDLEEFPDLAPAFAVGMALGGLRFHLTGLSTLHSKESDRIASISEGLRALGFRIESDQDSIGWKGERHPVQEKPLIRTFSDHRIAMAFAPALALGLCEIEDKEVVSKSYPEFWKNFQKML